MLLVAAVLAALVGIVAGLIISDREPEPAPPPPPNRFAVPRLDVAPGTAVPHQVGAGQGGQATIGEWAEQVADKIDVPVRALLAYAEAERLVRASTPRCHLTWATLAGVGRMESRHGLHGGAAIGEDGRLSRPIIGVALDGSPGLRAIKDTDGGRLDGDTRWDRAVGSMQFLPRTWSRWAARSGGDGQAPDPQDMDDSALTAARYLCASGGDLATAGGWWKAVLTYNASATYGQDVFSGADAYARAATAL